MTHTSMPLGLSVSDSISEILLRHGPQDSTVVPLAQSRTVGSISTSDFSNLADFRKAYEVLSQPVLCFIRLDELSQVTQWVRSRDDISVVGEPASLTQWRLDRVAQSCVNQMDPVTQVYQRSHLVEALARICPAANPNKPVSLILLDIDNFKAFNDEFGPAEGNRLLEQLGTLIISLCRMTLVARTRGGEFGVIVEASESVARRIAEVLLRSVNEKEWSDHPVTVSFGVATITGASSPSALLVQSDEALFAAKANGRNCIVCHSEIVAASNQSGEGTDVINMENRARVMSERVTSFLTRQSRLIMQNLRREANTDSLTKLFSRRYLDRKLQEDFDTAVKDCLDLSIALVDVDHFGEVNKVHGWPTGDRALQQIAKLIKEGTRSTDWVGRYGGEEICVVMPGVSAEKAEMVCERIRASIESAKMVSSAGVDFGVTISIGVSGLRDMIDSAPKDLIERVSRLTLMAKNGGRNRVVCDTP